MKSTYRNGQISPIRSLTKRVGQMLATTIAIGLAAQATLVNGLAQTILIDFGGANVTSSGPSPNDPNASWNNANTIGTTDTGVLSGLVTTLGAPTSIGITMVSRFAGVNEVGTQVSTVYPINATRDSMFGNTELFGTLSNIFPSFKLTGLAADSVYNFSFYASRTQVGDNRETGYTVVGANNGFTALDAANNIDNVSAPVSGIVPDASGEITISLAPTANNNNANHFTYLGVLKIEVVPPQTPLTFTLEPVNQRIVEFEPVTFTSAVEGPGPYSVQWYSNSIPIPGANHFNYTIPSTTLEMNGSEFSVSVSNLMFGVLSSNATLRVINDLIPPTIISVNTGDGLTFEVVFSELVDPGTAGDEFSYAIDDAVIQVATAEVQPDGRTVILTLQSPISGMYQLYVSYVLDLSGNEIAAGTVVAGEVPSVETQSLLFDFGGSATTERAPAPDDPDNHWNNITPAIGSTDTGILPGLITAQGVVTGYRLEMIRRFNGDNGNGTTTGGPFPSDATRDSLYGNTESWNELVDIFPSFKLAGLNPELLYNITFYASRTGVGDNRETGYTLQGANAAFATLNAANNITNTVTVEGMAPDSNGEISISLAPTPNNNNGNHFTYLGVMRVDPVRITQEPIVFTSEPVSQTVNVGQPVTFSATVEGTPPYFVQWLSNDVAIPGANQLSYTIPAVLLDMDGAQFSVNVSNLMFSATSAKATLSVNGDLIAPTLVSVSSLNGVSINVLFNEDMSAGSADPVHYSVNGGAATVVSATLQADKRTVVLTVSPAVSGTFTVVVNGATDLAGNPVAPDSSASGTVPVPSAELVLIDFGAANTGTTNGAAPNDPLNYWNNVPVDVGNMDTGMVPNLVNAANGPSGMSFAMVRRFNGVNTAGTTGSPLFPVNATRDTLFGNTEVFGGLTDIFPSFKLTGLNPSASFSLTFFASRTGVSDIRECGYTVEGANTGFGALDASNNTTNTVTVAGIQPTAGGEITVSMAPTARNNNGNHFTYLGVLKIETESNAPRFLPPALNDGQIGLDWIGQGVLEWAPTVLGPWTEVSPAPAGPPYGETIIPGQNRFYRLRKD